MHILFSEKELEWIEKRKYGWPIKRGCPSEIRKSIEKKKKTLDGQMKER